MPNYEGGSFEFQIGGLRLQPGVSVKWRDEVAARVRYEIERTLAQMGAPREIIESYLRTLDRQDASTVDVEPLKAEIQRLNAVIQLLKSAPQLLGLVLQVKGDRATLLVAGRRVEVPRPATASIVAGDSVRVTPDTMQILSRCDDDVRAGEVVTLKAVLPNGMGEIERGGSSRAIVLPGTAAAGDRVIVDDSGTLALAVLGPEPGKCIFGERTGVTWEDVGGLATAKAQLREAIEGPFRDRDRFARFARRPTRGILLYGAPGCGKSLLGKAAATAIAGLHGENAAGGFYYIKGPELLNMYVGNTEASIRKMFDDARRHKKQHGFPAVIFLDEADAILGRRGGLGFGLERTIVPAFLAEMDGLGDSSAIVLLATNRPGTLDPAIVRDGRVDRRIHVTRPTKDDARAIAHKALTSKPGDAEGLAEALVDELFAPRLVLAKVYRKSKGELSEKLTLGHVVSGALVVGILERATSAAMVRGAHALEERDVRQGVLEAFNESLDVNHEDELLEQFGALPDVSRVAPGKPIGLKEASP